MDIEPLRNYLIFQKGTAWPIAGFVMESDAEHFLEWARGFWPGTAFRMVPWEN